MIIETAVVGAFSVNCYVVAERAGARAVIIDPGDDERLIRALLHKHGLTPGIVVNTHGHIDHIGCDDVFGVPVYAHRDEVAMLRDAQENLSGFLAQPFTVKAAVTAVDDRALIECDGVTLEVIHTPGHSPGGICLLCRCPAAAGVLFSGDTLFARSVGRTDFPGADEESLLRGIRERLMTLPDETIVYPGHGPRTTIGKERRANPFIAGPHD
jgi:glyoxylase-like metal-dependent hydrolase (beta-lactamase superfamily II)